MSSNAKQYIPSRLRLSALPHLLASAILTLPVHLTSAQHNRGDLQDGGAIIIQDQGVTIRFGINNAPRADTIPPDEELLKIDLSENILSHVAQLDHADYEQREAAMDALIGQPGDNGPIFALLARSTEYDLSPEQHNRLMAALRERIMNTPGGALGISLRPQQNVREGRIEVEVTDLLPGLPAIEVLRVGDRIVAIEGEPFQATNDLTTRVQMHKPGEVVTLTVLRPKRDEDVGFLLNNRAGMDELEVSIELGSTVHLRDPATGVPQISPFIAEQRRQEVREAERRFQREPVRIELDGELPGTEANGVMRGGPHGRAVGPERPDLSDALRVLILNGDEEMAIEILNEGAPANDRDDRGVSVLHFAARATMPNLTRRLLERGAQVDARIGGGFEPIHWAARAGASGRIGAVETVDVLLEFGANINARAETGVLPISYAIQLGNDTWRDFLISRGAVVE